MRLSTRAQLAAGPRVRALGSDDNYHLRRARFAVAHFPRTIVFDPLMNFPSGGVPIWPPLHDLLLAAPSRLLHGPAAPAAAVERGAAWVPPVLAAATIVLAGVLAGTIAGPAGGAIAALFLAVCPGHILWTQYGHTDQHVSESFFGTLAFVLWIRSRGRQEEPRRGAAREALAGLALAAAVLAWQGGIYWGAIFALGLVLEAARTRASVLRPAVLGLGLAAAVVFLATAAWLGPFRPPLTYVSFGFFQPLFLAALAGGTVAIDTALRAARRQVPRREALRRLLLLAAAAAVVLPFAAPLAGGLGRGIGYVLGQTSEVAGGTGYVSYPRDWLKGIFEARPLFADGPGLAWRQLSAAFFLAPAVIGLWIVRAWRGDRPDVHIPLAVWGAVTLVLAAAQRLNVYYAALLAAVCLAEAARFVSDGVARAVPGSRLRPALAGGALALGLAAPMAAGLRAELSAVRVPGADLFTTLDWMRREIPHDVGAYDARLLAGEPFPELSRAGAVLAPWSLGHLVLYNAELPVVANNFGYGFLDSIRFFLATTEEEALAIAHARRARWVLAADLVPRMNDYASYLGRPPLIQGAPESPSPSAAYFGTLQSRLYDFDGMGARIGGADVPPLASFRLRYRSQSAIRRGGRWLARWKVFEIVPDQRGP
ncbi:MAG: STT3 domain-containing protein [Acidobacteriota bacterium]